MKTIKYHCDICGKEINCASPLFYSMELGYTTEENVNEHDLKSRYVDYEYKEICPQCRLIILAKIDQLEKGEEEEIV